MANKKINPGVPLLDTKPKKDKKVIINTISEKEYVEPQTLKEVIEDTTPKRDDKVEELNEKVVDNNIENFTETEEEPINEQFEDYHLNLTQEISKGSFTMDSDEDSEPTSPLVPPPPIFTGSADTTVGKAITFNHTTRHDGGVHF
jgi:hypothetical protein